MSSENKNSFFGKFYAFIAWVVVMALWGCIASTWVNPSHFRFLGALGVAFPIFLAGVILVLLLGLLVAPRKCWIPVLGLVVSFSSIREYCPINLPEEVPEGSIKVMSYNSMAFGNKKKDDEGRNAVAANIGRSGADIVCVQEWSGLTKTIFQEDIQELSGNHLTHYDTIRNGIHHVGIISHYPIVGKRCLSYGFEHRMAEFKLLLAPNDTLRVVNCHLKSMRLTPEDRSAYQDMVTGQEKKDIEKESRNLISKIARASVVRAAEVEVLCRYLEENAGKSIVLCGDFNDTPISYAHHRVTELGLTNAFTASGNGIGRSFNRDAIYVRIDHILYSQDWTAYQCRVEKDVQHSDHYPITCWLSRLR